LVEFIALAGNIIFIAVLTALTYRKTKILSISVFYSVAVVVIILFSSNLLTNIMVMLGVYPSLAARSYVGNNITVRYIYMLSLFPVTFIISRFAGKLLKSRMAALDTVMQNKFALYMLGGTSITLVLFFVHTFLEYANVDAALLGMLYTLSLMVYLGFLSFSIFTFTEKKKKEAEVSHQKELLENLQMYTTNLEEMAVGLRTFKHDHRNLLLSFHEHLENNDLENAKKQFQEYVGYSAGILVDNDSDLNNLSQIKIPELRGLLMFKLMRAIQQNIAVRVEISEPIGNIDSGIVLDLCRIIGILFDNAIEACLETTKPELRFLALYEGAALTLLLTNSCGNVPQLDKLFERGFTTKAEGRGLGLYTVSQILAENEMLSLRTGAKDGFIEQEVNVF
jgi:two-component system sensor histidine kinase AgrC